MPRAKTPRTPATENKQVIPMPEANATAPAKKAKNPTPSSVSLNPTPIDLEAQIRQRAYELYVERGRVDGFENEDWLKAELEIRGRLSRAQSA
jgi:hypothetical protein